jgi:hypothetical protein
MDDRTVDGGYKQKRREYVGEEKGNPKGGKQNSQKTKGEVR